MICWCLSRSVHCIYFYPHSKIYNKDVELTGKEYTKDNIFFVTLKILLFVPCSCCWLIKSDLWRIHPQQKNAFFWWMQENHSRAFFLLHISRHHTSHSHNLAHLEIESHCSPQAVTIVSLISTGEIIWTSWSRRGPPAPSWSVGTRLDSTRCSSPENEKYLQKIFYKFKIFCL